MLISVTRHDERGVAYYATFTTGVRLAPATRPDATGAFAIAKLCR
jgi:hypothetical protein